MAKTVDPHKISDVLRTQAALHILPRFRQLASHEIMSKTSPTDLVTVADQEMERALIKILPDILPGSVVLGEESVSTGDITLDVLDDTSRPIWVTDPVDGTFNFAHGREDFCTMLALVVNGQTQMSWIYDPLSTRMMIAERGSGAFINDKKLILPKTPKPLADMNGFAGLRYFPKSVRPHIEKAQKQVRSLYTMGCAGHEYLRLAQGFYDFSIYTRVKPWDHLAGQLMMQEAGGYHTKWDGAAYTPQSRTGGILVVTNQDYWKPLHNLFLTKLIEDHQKGCVK